MAANPSDEEWERAFGWTKEQMAESTPPSTTITHSSAPQWKCLPGEHDYKLTFSGDYPGWVPIAFICCRKCGDTQRVEIR